MDKDFLFFPSSCVPFLITNVPQKRGNSGSYTSSEYIQKTLDLLSNVQALLDGDGWKDINKRAALTSKQGWRGEWKGETNKLSQAGGDKCLGQLVCLCKSLSYKLHTKVRFLVTVGGLGRLHPHFSDSSIIP